MSRAAGPGRAPVRDFSRLLSPSSVAIVGGGAWCEAVAGQLGKFGFGGRLWRVHPTRGDAGRVEDLPHAPDAAFIGVNRFATVEVVAALSRMGAGGAVCFASGFREAAAEDGAAGALQDRLLEAAGTMPILGPNCYGFVNALDRACLWPDQHGLVPRESGVAILTQSSNIGINLTMQARALPIAVLACIGNQAQTSQAELARALLRDPRITALGVHVEGFTDLRGWEALAEEARGLGKRIVALKVGRSQEAQAATVSHTASLAGSEAGAGALLARLGIASVRSLPEFLEALKLLHFCGPLPSAAVATISCSGGEASLSADTGLEAGVHFPPLNDRQKRDLRSALGPMVALANPLDYHTYIWRDTPAMTRAFSAMVDPALALTLLVVDFPRADRCDPSDWRCVIDAAIATRAATGGRIGMVATLPEAMPEAVAEELAAQGVVPLFGLPEAMRAVAAAAAPAPRPQPPLLLPGVAGPTESRTLAEAAAKALLAHAGVPIPRGQRVAGPEAAASAAAAIGFPCVLKGEGFAHKTEAGAVRLGLRAAAEVRAAAEEMGAAAFLVEEMVEGGVTELLVGVLRDSAHGFVLTLGAGGVLAELLRDSQSLLVPAPREDVRAALEALRLWPLLAGWRGARGASVEAIVDAVMAVQDLVMEKGARLLELEINPLICTPERAVAADALIRLAEA